MEIPASLIRRYLDLVTVGWFNHEEVPPDEVAAYAPLVAEIGRHLRRHGDGEPLRLGLEHLLGNPEIDCAAFGGGRYPFDDEEVREIMRLVHRTLWPDAGPVPPGGPPGVRVVERPAR